MQHTIANEARAVQASAASRGPPVYHGGRRVPCPLGANKGLRQRCLGAASPRMRNSELLRWLAKRTQMRNPTRSCRKPSMAPYGMCSKEFLLLKTPSILRHVEWKIRHQAMAAVANVAEGTTGISACSLHEGFVKCICSRRTTAQCPPTCNCECFRYCLGPDGKPLMTKAPNRWRAS